MHSDLFDRIDRTVTEHNMLRRGDRVVAAVSGGADSMLLLHYLLSRRESLQIEIIVAHVEHGIRGESSQADAAFVRDFCARQRLPYFEKAVDVPGEAKAAGMGVEAYARQVRYAFFQSLDCDRIATAHTLSDSVETMLFRLARGTGLRGLTGIAPVRGKIIRPLLACTGQEVRAACGALHIDFRVDESNADERYSRNAIRHTLIPEFDRVHPGFVQNAARTMGNLQADEAYLQVQATELLQSARCADGLQTARLTAAPLSLRRRALTAFLEDNHFPVDALHLTKLDSILQTGGRLQLPGGFACVQQGLLTLETAGECTVSAPVYEQIVVSVAEFLTIRELSQIKIDFYCDYDKITGSIRFRQRQAGDRISPAGRGCSKTMKKLFCEYRIPHNRRTLPLVAEDDLGIVAVAGCCCDQRVAVDGATRRVLYVVSHTED